MHAFAADNAIRVLGKTVVEVPREEMSPPATHRLRLSLAVLQGAGWAPREVIDAATRGAKLLSQCSIATERLELNEVSAPDRYRSLFTPLSRRLAEVLALPKPAIFFVADTRQRPAFDAEAIGRGNSRTRPEMADTVWIVRGAKDIEIVIAHELAHVLANSGDHSDEAGNLMREETAAGGTRLTSAQCEAILRNATASGLVQPAR